MDSGTLLDFIPPLTMVGVRVIRESALSMDANLGLSGSTSAIISSIFSGEALCSIAKSDRCSKILVEVSRSAWYCSIRVKT